MIEGIYTLANDNVYDSLVALLNSIEVNYRNDMPVCVIPYDDNVERVQAEIARRPQVALFDDAASIARWEEFAKQAWSIKRGSWNTAERAWGRHKLGVHRKFCCFDGSFERFIFMDADTLVMKPLDFVFTQLDQSDFVVYDFQHKDASHVYDVKSARLYDVFPKERIDKEIFCAGFFASKKGLFDDRRRTMVISGLRNGDSDTLYSYAAEQSLMNYAVMKTEVKIHNFALDLPAAERTGNSVTSRHFEAKDNILYDKGRRLTYLHYIGITTAPFRQLCAGQNIDFPYRDVFLHYRYLRAPKERPILRGKPRPYNKHPRLLIHRFREIITNLCMKSWAK